VTSEVRGPYRGKRDTAKDRTTFRGTEYSKFLALITSVSDRGNAGWKCGCAGNDQGRVSSVNGLGHDELSRSGPLGNPENFGSDLAVNMGAKIRVLAAANLTIRASPKEGTTHE